MKDGSYSVEAALIMPVVIFIMLGFIMLGFSVRDIVFAEAYGRNLLLEVSDDTQETEKKNFKESLKECLWCSDVRYFDYVEGKTGATIRYGILSRVIKLPIENTLSIAKKEKTAEKLRRWNVIADATKKLIITEGE